MRPQHQHWQAHQQHQQQQKLATASLAMLLPAHQQRRRHQCQAAVGCHGQAQLQHSLHLRAAVRQPQRPWRLLTRPRLLQLGARPGALWQLPLRRSMQVMASGGATLACLLLVLLLSVVVEEGAGQQLQRPSHRQQMTRGCTRAKTPAPG